MEVELLKQKILDLAIRGKLVPQDPNDEPASVLIEKIKLERDKLIKEKKIKKPKEDSYIYKGDDNRYYENVNGKISCIDDEIPFEIPNSWCWCRLKEVGIITGGGTPSTSIKEYWENGAVNWLTPADMGNTKQKYIYKTERHITLSGLEKSSAVLMPIDTIVMSSRAPIGYLSIAKIPICTNQGCKSITLFNSQIVEYVYYAINYRLVDIKNRATGTTFKEISGKGFGDTIIPLPPINEQKTITKIILETNSILGKISSENKSLIKIIELLKYKILNAIFSENSRYKSYYTHKEEKLSKLSSLITKGSTPTTYGFEYLPSGINFIKVENVSNYKVQHDTITQFISNEAHAYQKRSKLQANDMLISIAGTLGRICLINNRDLPANTNQAFAIIRGYTNSLLPEYLKWYLTWYIESKSQNIGHGGGMNNLTLGEIKSLNISYPDMLEQENIVTYIDNCMVNISKLVE